MKANHLAIWNLVGAFLLSYCVIFALMSYEFPRGDWNLSISIFLHLCLIPIVPTLSFMLLKLDANLQALWGDDSRQKIKSLLHITCILFVPLIPVILTSLNWSDPHVPYFWCVSLLFSCGMLLWASASAYWQVRQSKMQHEKVKRGFL